MHKFRPIFSMRLTRFCLAVGTVSGVAALGLGGQTAWADSSCTPPNNGPTGPAAATFSYQCDGTYAGDWTNTYYVYDPNTGVQTPLYSPNYTYDCTTGTWTQTEWDYDAASSAYVEDQVAAATPPDQTANCSTVGGSNSSDGNANSGSAADTTNTPTTTPDSSDPDPTSSPANTAAPTAPPDPSATCLTPSTTAPTVGAANTATLNNDVCSQSQSGDATVADNGSAGDATSGDATTEVNVANLVQTLSNVLGTNAVTFTTNVDGDVNGDLVLDPSTILASAANTTATEQPSDIANDATTDAAINNTITADAASGNATVSGNGDAGDAATGDAEAIVNLINMINSAVAAGQSFIGTININGDLNGDILIPQSVIDQILAYEGDGSNSSNGDTGLNNNESIANNIDANATSGSAAVTDNQNGGNATTGDAATNVTIMNLTGSSIVGKNVLLVFVNVLGQWVGMIVNAPTGATSAEFGGGITNDTPSTGNNAVEADANLSITNNIDANAASGDALVSHNYNGGNATSGNADTAVNILNVEDSTLSLANWFGILFINVFGTWNGNFGILPSPVPGATSDGSGIGTNVPSSPNTVDSYSIPHQFASFLGANEDAGSGTGSAATEASAVLGDATTLPSVNKVKSVVLPSNESGSHDDYIVPAVGLFLAVLLILFAERDRLTQHKG
jgi:hypothetical protein